MQSSAPVILIATPEHLWAPRPGRSLPILRAQKGGGREERQGERTTAPPWQFPRQHQIPLLSTSFTQAEILGISFVESADGEHLLDLLCLLHVLESLMTCFHISPWAGVSTAHQLLSLPSAWFSFSISHHMEEMACLWFSLWTALSILQNRQGS